MLKRAALLLNVLAFFAFVVLAVCLLCFPDALAGMGLRGESGKVLLLQIISLMLLLGGFQASLSTAWRRTSLAAAFLVLAESSMMSLLLPGLR